MKKTASTMTCCASRVARPCASKCGRWWGSPLFASAIFSSDILERLLRFKKRVAHFVELNAHLLTQISNPSELGMADRILLSPVNRHKLTRILQKMLDSAEFLSPYGIRALSRYNKKHPYIFTVEGYVNRVDVLPTTAMSSRSNARRVPAIT